VLLRRLVAATAIDRRDLRVVITSAVAATGAVISGVGAVIGIVVIVAGTGAELVWVAKAANDGAGVVVDGGAGTV
jgi:hypothetical protein